MMKALGLLICASLMLGGCTDLLNGRACRYQLKETVSLMHIQKTPKTKKLAQVIYFADGSANLTKAEKYSLRLIAQKARQMNVDITVMGHSSSRTKPVSVVEHTMINLNISNLRAVNVINVLAEDGVPLHKMRYEALSDSSPAEPEVNAKAEALNRRVEIFYVY